MKKHELLQEVIDTVIDCCDNFASNYDNIFYTNAEVICFEGGKIRISLRANANGKIAVLLLLILSLFRLFKYESLA